MKAYQSIISAVVMLVLFASGTGHAQLAEKEQIKEKQQINEISSSILVLPLGNRCRVGGLLPYSRTSFILTNSCNQDDYATACQDASDNHNTQCENWCKRFKKRGDPNTMCKGESNPVAEAFDEKVHCEKTSAGGTRITCKVIGPCVCDP